MVFGLPHADSGPKKQHGDAVAHFPVRYQFGGSWDLVTNLGWASTPTSRPP